MVDDIVVLVHLKKMAVAEFLEENHEAILINHLFAVVFQVERETADQFLVLKEIFVVRKRPHDSIF